MLWQRLLTAAVGIPLVLAVTYLGGWYLAGVVALLGAATMREFFALVGAARTRARSEAPAAAEAGRTSGAGSFFRWAHLLFRAFGYVFAVIFPVVHTMTSAAYLAQTHLIVGLPLVGVTAALARRRGRLPAEAMSALATGLGALILPALLSYLVLLRSLGDDRIALSGLDAGVPAGACWLFLTLAACWVADTAAYAVGKTWGRHKLCPKISPGKTVEGAIASVAAAVLFTGGLGSWFGIPLHLALVMGAILGVVGQVGDLSESKLKRWAGVKDSGGLLPGHGGALDRFDSLLFSAPTAYYYLRFVVGVQ
jgi:phosphatidate cytidylyltransferase